MLQSMELQRLGHKLETEHQEDENSGDNRAKGMVPNGILCGVGESSRSHASLMICYILL